jgi:hypothetical protein
MIYIVWASIIWLWIQLKRWFKGWFRLLRRKPRGWRRNADSAGWDENIKPGFGAEPKPPWVKEEVIRLKAFKQKKGSSLVLYSYCPSPTKQCDFHYYILLVLTPFLLNGKVPAEVWMKRTFNAKKSAWYEDETGLLRDYYLPPD